MGEQSSEDIMGKLFYCIGLPRSSKSTQCAKWLNYENRIINGKFHEILVFDTLKGRLRTENRVVVSGDEIRKALYGSLWNQLAEDFVDAVKWVMVRTLLNSGHTVLLDETNTSERNIRKIFEIDPNAEFVYVDTSVEVCKNRASDTLWKPINRMYANLQELDNRHGKTPDIVSFGNIPTHKQLRDIIQNLKYNFLEEREAFTNESRNTPEEYPELPEVPVTPKPTVSSATCTWTTTIPDVPGYQVW